MILGGHQQVGVDQDAEHAEGFVVFDETHAAHVGGEVVDDGGVFERGLAIFEAAEIELQVLDFGEALIPLFDGFDIDGSDVGVTAFEQIADEVATDEPTAAADDYFLVFKHLVLSEGACCCYGALPWNWASMLHECGASS